MTFPRRQPALLVSIFVLAVTASLSSARAASLRPSGYSLERQNRVAHRLGLTFTDTRADLERLVHSGRLVPVRPNRDFTFKEVSFPYALPATRLFVERTARQYRETCGEELVVTSLARPRRLQPRNASYRSVHPAGMALDLHRSWNWRCRRWLEGYLLALESQGVLEASREHSPSHYHIAVFPRSYVDFVGRMESAAPDQRRYIVLRGDTLWKIAHRLGSTIEAIRFANALASDQIHPGQILQIPSAVTAEIRVATASRASTAR